MRKTHRTAESSNELRRRNKPLVALTGATGFIGQWLRELPKRGYRLRVLLRRPSIVPIDAASAVVGDLARPVNMAAALADVDAVIHSAGLAHAMSGVPEDDYRMLNTQATIGLARAAQRAGAKRFVFLSSIRAQSGPDGRARADRGSGAAPTDAYGRSKLAAEQGLAELDLDWVALRLVLVYGTGVKGNMAELRPVRALALSVAVARARWRGARCSHSTIWRRRSMPCSRRPGRCGGR